jgi:hypothetical protein
VINEALKYQRNGTFKCSVTGRKWAVADAGKAERIVCKAKLAQVWWSFNSPDWALPVLPVNEYEIFEIVEMMEAGRDEPFTDALVATFARSLAHLDYNFTVHPGIEDWVRNYMALHPKMRSQLQHLGLKPKPLDGFNWRSNLWEPLVVGLRETGFARRI